MNKIVSISAGLFVLIVLMCIPIVAIVLTLWTDRTIDFWLTYFKGVPIDCPLWISFLIAIITNSVGVMLNILSEIVRLVI